MPVTRTTIALIFAALALAGLSLAWLQRTELAEEWKVTQEIFPDGRGTFPGFFCFRSAHPHWQPGPLASAKGGERPMDFSYFNAVIKSTSFPPYDPWFAGGYINYYYYGFVLVATPVKLLGIVPTLAYNFILPTLFAMVGMGAFCVGWNLMESDPDSRVVKSPFHIQEPDPRFVAGLLAALLMVVLGNLGTVRMIYQGLERMAAPGGIIDNANIGQRIIWAAEGSVKAVDRPASSLWTRRLVLGSEPCHTAGPRQ